MIRRDLPGRVVEFYADDGETLLLRVTLPERMTIDDVERFREHLIKLAKEQEVGPS